ncbi:hypothetical protein [Naasia aerilata]|uniref:hypothetical protein n=1 Tax=Naasia aerilata TaxID=1162966 RepID=UPI002572AE57|nr:hypothetical protein [Naasia aerilata]
MLSTSYRYAAVPPGMVAQGPEAPIPKAGFAVAPEGSVTVLLLTALNGADGLPYCE